MKKPELLNLLMAHDRSLLNAQNNRGRTCLHEAAFSGNLALVTSLIRFGAGVEVKDGEGNTPLHLAMNGLSQQGSPNNVNVYDEICAQLIDAMSTSDLLSLENNLGNNCFVEAVLKNNAHVIKKLLSRSSEFVRKKSSSGLTPLHVAMSSQKTTAAQLLLESPGIDIECKDQFGRSPLHFAILKGNYNLVEAILAKHAVIDLGCFRYALKFWDKESDGLVDLHSPFGSIMCCLSLSGLGKKLHLAISLYLISKASEDQINDSSFKEIIAQFKERLDTSNLPFSKKDSVRFLFLSYISAKVEENSAFIDILCNFDYSMGETAAFSDASVSVIDRSDSIVSQVESETIGPSSTALIHSCIECKDSLAVVRFKPCNHQITCQFHAEQMSFCSRCGVKISKKMLMDIDGNVIGEIYLSTKSADDEVEPEDSGLCSICWDQKRNITFIPCGHGACSVCAEKLFLCHFDRKPITNKVRMIFP